MWRRWRSRRGTKQNPRIKISATYKQNLKNVSSCCLQINNAFVFECHRCILWSYPSPWGKEIRCLFQMRALSLGDVCRSQRKPSGLSHRVGDPQHLASYSQTVPCHLWLVSWDFGKAAFWPLMRKQNKQTIFKISAPKEVQKKLLFAPLANIPWYGDSNFHKKGEENSSQE